MKKKLMDYYLSGQLIDYFDSEMVEDKPIPGGKRFEMCIK